jgi:mono/diheme cytochrome c family protein
MKFTHLLLLMPFVIGACAENTPPTTQSSAQTAAAPDKATMVARGEYLVNICGCNDCHSPKRMGPNGPEIIPERMLSGYPGTQPIPNFDKKVLAAGFAMFTPDLTAAAGGWGVSFSSNLTPDETGLGNWTFAQFKKALTEGKSKGLDGSRMLLPPMPWVNYVKMKEEDLGAIFAYLQSIKPVNNVAPNPIAPM